MGPRLEAKMQSKAHAFCTVLGFLSHEDDFLNPRASIALLHTSSHLILKTICGLGMTSSQWLIEEEATIAHMV